jgi:hypothetical protein
VGVRPLAATEGVAAVSQQRLRLPKAQVAGACDDLTNASARDLEFGPFRDHLRSEEFYAALDLGIRFAVYVLHAAGIDTSQSCQGGEGHAYHRPTIEIAAGDHCVEGFAALAALEAYGLHVSEVALAWPVQHGMPYEKNWRIELAASCEERADEIPGFIAAYRAAGRRIAR